MDPMKTALDRKIQAQTPAVLAALTDRRTGTDRRAARDWVGPAAIGGALFLAGLLIGLLAH